MCKTTRLTAKLVSAILVLVMAISSFYVLIPALATETEAGEGSHANVLLRKESTWKYLDDGTNQGTAWRAVDFDDRSWLSGQAPLGYPTEEPARPAFSGINTVIGYGADADNKYATTYFRAAFEVEDLTAVGHVGRIHAGIDDSAILYLNGHEIARYNLPEDQHIHFDQYVRDFRGYGAASERQYVTFELTEEQLSHLVEGTNVIAVEVHQHRPTSSDVYWDMELITTDQEPIDPNVYRATHIAFAPGTDETAYNFSWYSNRTSAPGVVQYARKSDMVGDEFPSEKAQTFQAKVSPASSGFSTHKATITGIEEASEYVYRLGDDLGSWTDVYHFQTHDMDRYNFLFIGDPQIGSSRNVASDAAGWENTLNKAFEKFPSTSFILSAGDQVETSSSEREYDGYFSPSLLKRLPVATTIGNHDNSIHYKYHFNVPNESAKYGVTNAGGNYYFTHGDTLIMVLNSNNSNAEDHRVFMEETMAAHPNATWNILMFHHSIYSAANHSTTSATANLRNRLAPVIADFEIDVVFAGHDHSYVRTHQMKDNQPLKNQLKDHQGRVVNPTGTVFFTGNSSSGSKFYSLKPDPEIYAAVRHQLRVPTFMNVSVTPTALEFTTYRVDTMEVTDTYAIVKDGDIVIEEEILLNKESTWKYLDDGSDQGTAWRAPGFNDRSWAKGQAPLGYPIEEPARPTFSGLNTVIGYGPDARNKYVTTYFRTTFEVDDLAAIGNAGRIHAGIDDSAILYLNGQEIARYNLPEGRDISFDEYVKDFSGFRASPERHFETFELTEEQLSHLVEGTNVLAVEVHQHRPTSSDIYWDMELVTRKISETVKPAPDSSYIMTSAGEGGTISQTVTLTPDPGYEIDTVIIDGVENREAASAGEYTFDRVTDRHSIEVTFKLRGK